MANSLQNEDLDAINTLDLEQLLRSNGWTRSGGWDGVAHQWLIEEISANQSELQGDRDLDARNTNGREATRSILVPVDKTMADYRQRLREAIQQLEKVYADAGAQILDELIISSFDEIICRRDEATLRGSVRWDDGQRQVEGLKATLVAAAKATESRERYFGNRNGVTGRNYLSNLRMGQTREGSYIVTAISPIGPLPRTHKTGDYEETVGITGREVVGMLTRGLTTLREAVDTYGGNSRLGVFDEAVTDGVSYDLVRAVNDMVKDTSDVEMTVSWSRKEPNDQYPPVTLAGVFGAQDVAILDSAMRHLSLVEESQQVTILGRAKNLDRDAPGEPGIVTMQVIEGSQAKYIKVRLEDEYDWAIDSHRGVVLLSVTGRQERDGRDYWLYDATGIRIIDFADESDDQEERLF